MYAFLKSCPVCKKKVHVVVTDLHMEKRYTIECRSCGLRTKVEDDVDKLVSKWNGRR